MSVFRVMIVEDDEQIRTIIRARLEKLGHVVVAEAEDGAQAVDIARLHHPDAIIMDINMPVMDGIEATRIILGEQPCAILFLSSYDERELVERACETGALAYLMKPFRKEDIGPALAMAVKMCTQIQSQNKKIEDLSEALETRKMLDRAKGILMDRYSMTEAEAFKRIHYQARHSNLKMRDVAQSIINAVNTK